MMLNYSGIYYLHKECAKYATSTICLFVYVEARETQVDTALPGKWVSRFSGIQPHVQNNFNVFYTRDGKHGCVKEKGSERTGKKAGIEPLPPNPTPKMADPKQYLT